MAGSFEFVKGAAARRLAGRLAILLHDAATQREALAPEGFGLLGRKLPTLRKLTAMLQEPAGRGDILLVAMSGDEVAGLARAGVERYFDELVPKPYLSVEFLVVSSAFRGRGLGKLLMNELLRLGKDSGCAAIELRVQSQNEAAIGLYERMGFTELERRYAIRLEPR